MGWGLAILLVAMCCVAAEVSRRSEEAKRAQAEFKELLTELADDSHSFLLQQTFLIALKQPRFNSVPKALSEEAYRLALENLAANPSSSTASTFVMEVGRWHFTHDRANNLPRKAIDEIIRSQMLRHCGLIVKSEPVGWVE